MNRQVLLTLLAAGAAPAALADVDLTSQVSDGSSWTNDGLDSSITDDLKSKDLSNESYEVTSASAGQLSIMVADLPIGDYSLTFGKLTNASVQILANGTAITTTPKENTNTFEFSLTAASSVTIVVKSADQTNPYEFGNIKFLLVYDFNALKDELENAIYELKSIDEANEAGVEAFAEEKEALEKEIAALEEKIAKLEEETLDVYEELKLYTEPTGIENDVDDLNEEIDNYNSRVVAENARYAQQVANAKALAEVETSVKELQTALDEITTAAANYAANEDETNPTPSYPQDAISEAAEEIQEAIDQITADAKALYSGDNYDQKPADDDVTALKQAIEDAESAIEELSKAYAAAVAEAAAYAELQSWINKLAEVYGIQDEDGNYNEDSVLAYLTTLRQDTEYAAAQLAAAAEIYNTAIAELNKTELGSASKNAEDNETTYKDAEKALEDLLSDIQSHVTDAQTAFNDVMSSINELESDLNDLRDTTIAELEESVAALGELADVKNITLDDGTTISINDLLEAIKSAADDIETALDTAGSNATAAWYPYDTASFDGSDIEAMFSAINSNISNINYAIASAETAQSNLSTLEDWLKQLNDAKAAIEKEIENVPAEYQQLLLDLYQPSYDSIYNGIQQLIEDNTNAYANGDTLTITDDNETFVKDGISNYETSGIQAAKALADAYKTYDAALAAVKEYEAFSLKSLPGNDVEKSVPDITEALEAYKAGIEEALNGNAQNFYDKITSLTLTEDAGYVNSAKEKYADDFVNANLNILSEKADAYDSKYTADDADSTYGPGLSGLKDLLKTYTDKIEDIESNIEAAGTGEDSDKLSDLTNANEVTEDANIIDLYDQMIDALDAAEKVAIDNVKAKGLLDEVSGVLDQTLEDLEQWLKDNSMEPATTAWTNTDEYKALVGDNSTLATIKEAIDSTYNDNSLKSTEDANEDWTDEDGEKSYMAQLLDVQLAINSFKSSVLNNEINHNLLLELSNETRDYVNSMIDYINADENGFDSSVEVEYNGETVTISDLLEILEGLVSETAAEGNITYVNNLVYNDYKKLQSSDDDTYADRVQKYEDIKGIVDDIYTAISDEYANQVDALNKATIDSVWAPVLSALELAYKQAVADYENYSQNCGTPTNPAYLAALNEQDGFVNTEWLYDYAKQISNLKIAANAIYTAAKTNTPQPTILTEDDYKDVLEAANDILNSITDTDEAIIAVANAFALKYYAEKKGEAESSLNEIAKILKPIIGEDATTAALASSYAAIAAADAYMYTGETYDDSNPISVDEPSLIIGNALAELANVIANGNAAAKEYWDGEYADAIKDANEFKDIVAGYGDIAADYLDQITKAIAEMEALDSKATEYDKAETLLDNAETEDGETKVNVVDLVDQLNALLEEIEKAADSAKTAYDNNKANNDQLETYLSDLEDLEAAYQAMVAAVGSLDLTLEQFESINTPGAYSLVEAVKEALDDCDDAYTNKNRYDQLFDAAKNAIEECYANALAAAADNLNEYLSEIKVAFNKAKADAIDEDGNYISDEAEQEINALNDEINEIIATINEINEALESDDMTAEDYAKAIANIVAAQEELNEIANDLPGIEPADNDAYNDAIEVLTAEFQSVSDTINDALSYLANCEESIQSKYQSTLEDALAALAEVEDAWTAEGNGIILTVQTYLAQMQSIAESVELVIEAMKAAQAVAEASNALAAEIQTQIDELQALLNDFAEKTAEYEYATTDTYVSNTQDKIDALQSELNEIAKDYALTGETEEETSISNKITCLTNNIASNLDRFTYQEALKQAAAAQDAAQDAYAEIMGSLHADQTALVEAISALKAEANELSATTVDDEGSLEANTELIAAAKRIMAEIAELIGEAEVVTLGDVNGDGNVNVSDFGNLLNIILSGEDYDAAIAQHVAADINGNEEINVSDLTLLSRMILGEDEDAAAKVAPRSTASNTVTLQQLSVNNGVRTIAVLLSNETTFTNTQLDINLPDGMYLVSESLDTRAAALTLYSNDLDENTHRIVIASETLETLSGHDGAILLLELGGSSTGDITISNMICSDVKGGEYKIESLTEISGISTMTDYIKAGAEKIYDLGGRVMNRIQKGINIIVNPDGSTTKTLNN